MRQENIHSHFDAAIQVSDIIEFMSHNPKYLDYSKGRDLRVCKLADLGIDDVELLTLVMDIETSFHGYVCESCLDVEMTAEEFAKCCIEASIPI